jgi:tight adherence protein C
MELTIIVTASVFFMTLFTVFGISTYASARTKQKAWAQRLKGKEEFAATALVQESSAPEQPRLFKFLGAIGEATKPKNVDEMSQLRRTLVKAGYRSVEAPLIFFGARLLLAIAFSAAFAVLRTSALPMLPYTQTMFLFVLLAVTGFYGPNLWVKMRMQRRQQKITEGFPDALDLMTVCVEAGLGLDSALNQVRAEEKAAKLPVKLLFPLIFFIFPSMFVVIIGPAIIQIMRVLLPSMAR